MENKTKRMEEIMERVRIAFNQDSINKLEEIQLCLSQWTNQELSKDSLIETIYHHAHGIKGLALTFEYSRTHEACEQILDFILQQEGNLWTSNQLNILFSFINQLNLSLESDMNSHPNKQKTVKP